MPNLARAAILAIAGLCLMADLGYRSSFMSLIRHVPGRDLTGHFVLMGGLALMVNLGFSERRIAGRRLGIAGCSTLVLLGVSLEELSQAWLPTRSFSILDLLASIGGIGVGAILAAAWLHFRMRPRPADPSLNS